MSTGSRSDEQRGAALAGQGTGAQRASGAVRHKPRESAAERARHEREVSLLELIDRLLAGGVVIHGDITLAAADVDLVYVGLRALVASVDAVGRDLQGTARPAGGRGVSAGCSTSTR